MIEMVTIDGPAGSGKSTVSRMVAKRMGYSYLDTGAMYRAIALVARHQDMDFGDGPGLGRMCHGLNLWFDRGDDPPKLMLGKQDISGLIRSSELDMLSSTISAIREVREAMMSLQRDMAKGGRFVAEGRDMGTVVFPEARWKFFLTASVEVRAERRYRERRGRGEAVTKEGVAEELKQRDDQDQRRALSPLRPAVDAVMIDSTTFTAEEVVERILKLIWQR